MTTASNHVMQPAQLVLGGTLAAAYVRPVAVPQASVSTSARWSQSTLCIEPAKAGVRHFDGNGRNELDKHTPGGPEVRILS